MKGMKRKFFLKRMWNFVVVMLIPALLLVAVTTYMTFVTQMHRMTQDNERGIEAVRSNISLVLDSVLAQNSYMTGMTRTNMVLNKALKRESLSYTDAIYLRSLVSSLNSMTNAYDYVDSVLIYIDGYDRALTSSGLVNLSADDYSGWYSVYSSMSDAERTCIAPVVVNAGKASERRQLVVCARMLTMEGCVAVTLNISHLQEIIAVLRPSDNQHLYLVDGSGRLLAKAGDAGATEELQNLMGKTLSGAGNKAEQEHEFWIKLDDRDCLLNWQSYQNPDFYIVSTIDRAMILENLGERLMPLLLMAVVALYAIVFLAYVNTKRSFDEINLGNDVNAVNVVFGSTMPVWQVPKNVYEMMPVSMAELEYRVRPQGAVGRYLFDQLVAYSQTPESRASAFRTGESWVLGDNPAPGLLLYEHRFQFDWVPAPYVTADQTYAAIGRNRPIRVYKGIDSRLILDDLYAKLALFAQYMAQKGE